MAPRRRTHRDAAVLPHRLETEVLLVASAVGPAGDAPPVGPDGRGQRPAATGPSSRARAAPEGAVRAARAVAAAAARVMARDQPLASAPLVELVGEPIEAVEQVHPMGSGSWRTARGPDRAAQPRRRVLRVQGWRLGTTPRRAPPRRGGRGPGGEAFARPAGRR